MKTDGFYIKHKNREEAIEFIDLVVGRGYVLDDGVDGHHRDCCPLDPEGWNLVGVNDEDQTEFFHTPTSFDPKAKLMTLQQVRDMFKDDEEKASPLSKQVDGDHYKKLKIQPVEYNHANNIPFIEGCIIKYATRWRGKGGIKDLDKIIHFAELLKELETQSK